MPLGRSLLLLLALASPALGQVAGHDGARDAAIAKDAAAAIATYLDGVRKSGGRPDYTKPPIAGLFHQVFNAQELAALPPPTQNDLGWLLDWTGAANRINILMTIFGTPPGGPLDPAVVKRNQTDYEGQCVAAMNFMIRIEAVDAVVLTAFMAQLAPEQRTPVREEGLQRSRQGAAELIVGAAIWITQGMKPANARLVTAALRDTKEVWAQYMLPDDRDKVVSVLKALQVAVKDDQIRKNVGALQAALSAAK